MKSLVTGGAGFIGSHLTKRLLERGHDVVVIDTLKRGNKLDKADLERVRFVNADVCNEAAMTDAAEGCDYIFHLAAVLGVDIVADNPVETMETEAVGMKNVATAAMLQGGCKIVYASTSGVYGKMAIEQAVDENFQAAPNSSYAIAKRFNEIYLQALHQEKNVESLAIRYFNVHGPKQDNRMVIPRFIEQAMAGKPLTVFGSGLQTRDFTFIDDAIEATILTAENIGGCEIFNVSYSREFSIKEVAEIIVELTGSSSEIAFITPPTGRYDFEVQRRFGNPAKLKKLVGYELNTSLRDGIRQTLEHMGIKVKA